MDRSPEAKEERIQKYVRLMKHLTWEFDKAEFAQIPRSQNMMVDKVSKLASSEEGGISMDVEMEVKNTPVLKKC